MSLRGWGFRVSVATLVAALFVGPAPAEEPTPWEDFLDTITNPIQRLREFQRRQQLKRNLRDLSLMIEKMEMEMRLKTPQFPNFQGQPDPSKPGVPWTYLLPYVENDSVFRSYQQYLSPTAERLGAPVESVSTALASQLKLAKDQGQVVGEVKKDSAADKAGLKQHDVLLEMDGKAVPRAADAFEKALAALKPGSKVNFVVLREGQKVEVKNVPVQETKSMLLPWAIEDGTSNTLIIGEKNPFPQLKTFWAPSDAAPAAKGYQVIAREPTLTTVFRDGDRFTARLEEGRLIITVVGAKTEKDSNVEVIKVQDGDSEKRFTTLKDVPAEYRDKASHLISLGDRRE